MGQFPGPGQPPAPGGPAPGPMGPPPGQAPGPMPMPGGPPPGAPPMPPPGPPPALLAALAQASAPSPYQDLRHDLPHHVQLVDVAVRQLVKSRQTMAWYKTPKKLAVLDEHIEGLKRLVSSFVGSAGSEPEGTQQLDMPDGEPHDGGEPDIEV